jgi:hypothetical protein
MVKMFKRINKLQIVSMLGMIIVLILVVFNVNNIYNLFWIFVGLNIGGNLMFIDKWSKEGLTRFKKMDKNYNKNYTRKTSDSIFFILMAYVLVICIIFMIEFWIKSITQDLSFIIGVTIFSIFVNILDLYLVERTSKEVKETIKKGGK